MVDASSSCLKGRSTLVVVVALGLTSACSILGLSVDASQLGTSPIAHQVELMTSFDDEYATRFSSEWFAEECPTSDAVEVARCAERLGLTCTGSPDRDWGSTACTYHSEYRTRKSRFLILPSVDGSSASQWLAVKVSVRLEAPADSTARLVFTRVTHEQEASK